MADVDAPRPDRFATRMSLAGRPAARDGRHLINPPVHRGSTVVYPSAADRIAASGQRTEQALVYGTHGNPTHFALEDVVAEIEGGTRCQLVGSGLAAITTPLLAYLSTGDHLLVPDSVYGPTRAFCGGTLRRMGISTTFYDPCLDAAALRGLLRPDTRLLYLESPGSHTFEVQDVPALAAVARERGIPVMLDNTWGVHFFQPFRHGVDVSIQVLTKYIGGHSDVLLGAIVTNGPADWERVRMTALELGQVASPDDCWLALRGARTLPVRLARQMESGLTVARWLAERPQVARVLHPALPSCPGHAFWRRDFSGASSLFGVVFAPRYSAAAVAAMADSLRLFGIGASWGGFDSLVMPTIGLVRGEGAGRLGGEAMRLHVGLEDPEDLIEDLAHGLAVLDAAA
jgi:cystathionine beta-lyase